MLIGTTSLVRRSFSAQRPQCSAVIGVFLFSLGLYPLLGLAFFPAYGSWAVRHQCKSADRYAARADRPIHQARWKMTSGKWSRRRTSA